MKVSDVIMTNYIYNYIKCIIFIFLEIILRVAEAFLQAWWWFFG
jgi:hypothetical protein